MNAIQKWKLTMFESPKLQEILQKIEHLHPKKIDLSLGRMGQLLAQLGNPHQKMPPTIHIAGTNGKGSTHALCLAMLRAGGARVHAYTSPHLVVFNERIRIANNIISDGQLYELLGEILRVNNNQPITFFELTTIAAFKAFADTEADYLVCEVGLGGEFDSTNIIPHKDVAVFTPIDFDHLEFLGNTLSKIASAKAGILTKVNGLVVSARQRPTARDIINRHARAINQRVIYPQLTILPNKNWQMNGEIFQKPALPGRHQYDNASLAVQAVRAVNPHITHNQINQGLQNAEWPARLQNLTGGRVFTQYCPNARGLWLDGCHNNHGASVVAEWLSEQDTSDFTMVTALMNNRNQHEFLAHFAPFKPKIITTSFQLGHNAHPCGVMAQAARDNGIQVLAECPDHHLALTQLRAVNPRGLVLICGSLYLSGCILHENG